MAMRNSREMEEMIADLEKLEKLVATLPASPPPSPTPNLPGLSFSVSGIGLRDTGRTDASWELPRMPSELMDSTLSLDFGTILAPAGISIPISPNPHQNEASEGRGRLLVHYVGGSITFLLKIAVFAWSVRFLRRIYRQIRQRRAARNINPALCSLLSPAAVRKLVELETVDFLLIDVRHPSAVHESPCPLQTAISIHEPELGACLQLDKNEWNVRFPNVKPPAATDVLLFISTRGRRAQQAAYIASQLGFKKCCVLSGGIQSYTNHTGSTYINFLSRDAVALLLLEFNGIYKNHSKPYIVDVRRYDERSFYGFIPGSFHIPAEEWPKALAVDASEWEKTYKFPKFTKNDVLILYSRTSKRAIWVAQLCSDAGLNRCYVYKSGAYGWRLDDTVLPYTGYKQGDAPPEPSQFEVENFNREAAEIELREKEF